MKQSAFEPNEFLGANHDACCLIPQEDGSTKVCPKKSNGNRCACVNCPHNGEFYCQDETIDSLDALLETGYEPTPFPV